MTGAAQVLGELEERAGGDWLERLERCGEAYGLAPASWPFLAALLRRRRPETSLALVVEGARMLDRAAEELRTWTRWLPGDGSPAPRLLIFPRREEADLVSEHSRSTGERLEALMALREGPALVVAEEAALMQGTFRPEELDGLVLRLERGGRIGPEELVERLLARGYLPEPRVGQRGEASRRGGIVDVFPVSASWPLRIEFFGDEIESIREFDPHTQLSRSRIGSALVSPGGEISQMASPASGCLADHLPRGSLLAMCHSQEEGEPGAAGGFSWEEIRSRALRAGAEIRHWHSLEAPSPQGLPGFEEPARTGPEGREGYLSRIRDWLEEGWRVELFGGSQGELDRFGQLWSQAGGSLPAEGLSLQVGGLGGGWVSRRLRWAAVTYSEVVGRSGIRTPRPDGGDRADAVRSSMEVDFSELEPGDYVVHLQHGIGRFLGLQRGDGEARADEYLVIEYGASGEAEQLPRLHVPAGEAHLVSKYIGAGKAQPVLHVLGGSRWSRAKARAREAVQDLAGEMLSVQASRQEREEGGFPADSRWQADFESGFGFQETPDQIRAVESCKRDMESGRPMDRLICGDVGFGKTEVAIRAAFKAVDGGRQVALMVPTTVLAQQHYKTFRERMAGYPVRVEMLSGLRTRGRARRILQDLAEGTVDIVVGTHRLIQDDVSFKDLGLVVIDEEQRFGVRHKERFKRMRQLVDVLTLSATPIPRTLYLSLVGARDLSTIQTPPQDRLPVRTIVAPYDERIVRDAILRELSRQGQVYFLHNRVQTIERVAGRIRELVPGARVAVGHGQMAARTLERAMVGFVEGETDVLVATTIIESGLDIPNANTIVIDRADRFGLSDLYQLRGRVGRSSRQAYAYLMIPRDSGTVSDARRRMDAMRQYSRLGSGMQVALRDLEIRGAGNILGAQQSGHIAAIGFDLYCELLKQSVASLKGEEVRPRRHVGVRFDFLSLGREEGKGAAERPLASLCPEYIPDMAQRIGIYRRLALAGEERELDDLQEELRDRFGPLPPEARRLMQVARIKRLAAGMGIQSVEVRRGKALLRQGQDYLTDRGRMPRLGQEDPDGKLEELERFLEERLRERKAAAPLTPRPGPPPPSSSPAPSPPPPPRPSASTPG